MVDHSSKDSVIMMYDSCNIAINKSTSVEGTEAAGRDAQTSQVTFRKDEVLGLSERQHENTPENTLKPKRKKKKKVLSEENPNSLKEGRLEGEGEIDKNSNTF